MKAISDVSDCTKGKKDVVKQRHTSLLETLKNIGFDNLQNICFFKQPNMLLSYLHEAFWINLVIYMYYQRTVLRITFAQPAQIMLIFLCVWHDELCKNDPCLCLADDWSREKDQRTWDTMISGCFCVSKTEVPFTSIGADHGIEQENRALKVLEGIKGISNSSECLEEYFLSAAEMNNVIADFCEKFGIAKDEVWKRENHYQISGSKNCRIQDSVGKIVEVFHTYDVSFW